MSDQPMTSQEAGDLLGGLLHFVAQPEETRRFTEWMRNVWSEPWPPEVRATLTDERVRRAIALAHAVLAPECDTPIEVI